MGECDRVIRPEVGREDRSDPGSLPEWPEKMDEHSRVDDGGGLPDLVKISHELRTSLTTIIGFSEILAAGVNGPINEKQAAYLKIIYDSSRKLQAQTEVVLELLHRCGRGDPVVAGGPDQMKKDR